jgi:hypothetical protein
MRRKSVIGALGLVALVAGCISRPGLRPASGARGVPQHETMAYAEAHGVRVWADGDAWSSYPRDLQSVVTPVWVHIENRSERKVRLSYKDFTLVGANGFEYKALPPFSMSRGRSEGTQPTRLASISPDVPQQQVRVRVGVGHPRIYYHRFHVAPHYRPYYRPHVGFTFYDPWPYGYVYYDRYYDRWEPQLPTRDMLRHALPEGVVEAGGGVAGYLYFQRAYEAGSVRFEVQLVDAESEEQFGNIQIPFVVADN